MKRQVALQLSIGALLSPAVAVPARAQALPSIGVSIFDYSNTFMGFVRHGIENASKGKADVLIVDAQNDQTKQNDQIDTLISKGVKGLAINPVNVQAAATIIGKAKAAGLPVIFFNRNPSRTDMYSYERAWYVGIDPQNGGKVQADMIAQAFQQHPEYYKRHDGVIHYVLLKGTQGHPDAEARTATVTQRMKDLNLKTDQLELQSADFDTVKAKDVTETWIAKYGERIDLIICNNDAMALGALEALRGQGYTSGTKFTPVIGMNAISQVLDAIQSGAMLGSVMQSPWEQAQAVVTLSVNAATGKPPLAGTDWKFDDTKAIRLPDTIITRANLALAQTAYANCR